MEIDWSQYNFVQTCEQKTTATSTVQFCYSSAEALNQLLLLTLLFIVGIGAVIKLFHLKR